MYVAWPNEKFWNIDINTYVVATHFLLGILTWNGDKSQGTLHALIFIKAHKYVNTLKGCNTHILVCVNGLYIYT